MNKELEHRQGKGARDVNGGLTGMVPPAARETCADPGERSRFVFVLDQPPATDHEMTP
jgi:hypothetical protein